MTTLGRAKVIVNPVAGGGHSGKRWERLEPILRESGLEFDWVFTARPGDATRLAREAAEGGYEVVVAVGGDGTVNEVANGLLTASGGASGASLGIIPTGRGVDLCRTIGVPLDYAEAARRLAVGRKTPIDVGEVEFAQAGAASRRYFVNFAGFGFDVEVTRRANAISPHRRGTVPYLSSIFLSLFSYRNKAVELTLGDEVVRLKVNTIVFANGQYFGGGMRIAPQASPHDGQLDVVVLGDLNPLELIVNVPKVYEGTHIGHPKVRSWRVERAEVHSVDQLFFQVDGDPLGETPVRLGVLRGALNVLV